MTEELKALRRRRQRIYRKQGRSPKYHEIKDAFDNKLKAAALKYKEKIIAQVSEGKGGSSYSSIRKKSDVETLKC